MKREKKNKRIKIKIESQRKTKADRHEDRETCKKRFDG
jgi:hypothetical protein